MAKQPKKFINKDGVNVLNPEYLEWKKKGGKKKMKRVVRNLMPQGEVKYRVPRLHVDFPIILYSD